MVESGILGIVVDRGGMFRFCCGCVKLSAFSCAGVLCWFFVETKYIVPTALSSTILSYLCLHL